MFVPRTRCNLLPRRRWLLLPRRRWLLLPRRGFYYTYQCAFSDYFFAVSNGTRYFWYAKSGISKIRFGSCFHSSHLLSHLRVSDFPSNSALLMVFVVPRHTYLSSPIRSLFGIRPHSGQSLQQLYCFGANCTLMKLLIIIVCFSLTYKILRRCRSALHYSLRDLPRVFSNI